jgi:hypothetical protein
MTPQKQLLCKFATNLNYQESVSELISQYNLVDRKVFIFVNEKNLRETFLTFNVIKNDQSIKYKGVISVHRKKQTNTIYTLNAMNKLIADENNGTFDRNFQLNWGLYTDCLILTNDVGVKIVPLKLFSIVST